MSGTIQNPDGSVSWSGGAWGKEDPSGGRLILPGIIVSPSIGAVTPSAPIAEDDVFSNLRAAESCPHRDCVGCGCAGCRCELGRQLVTIRDCIVCVAGRAL